jgi:hypothetical protein
MKALVLVFLCACSSAPMPGAASVLEDDAATVPESSAAPSTDLPDASSFLDSSGEPTPLDGSSLDSGVDAPSDMRESDAAASSVYLDASYDAAPASDVEVLPCPADGCLCVVASQCPAGFPYLPPDASARTCCNYDAPGYL